MTIFASYPEIHYERLLNSDISVGGSVGVRPSDEEDYPYQFAVSPHFRWFFGGFNGSIQQIGSGFFIELNSAIFSKDENIYLYDSDYRYTVEKKSQFRLGASLAGGWKYISRNNWMGEIYIGSGRDF